MKRNPDLIRSLLFKIEELSDIQNSINLTLPGFSEEEIAYHIELLFEAGYLKAIDVTAMDNEYQAFLIQRLTWEGHDFIEAARNDRHWAKAKDILEGTGGFVLEIAKELLLDLVKKELSLR